MKISEALEILKRQAACERDEGCEEYADCRHCPNNVSDDDFIQALDTAISALEKSEQQWVPVSEKLPEEDVDVLATDDAGGIKTVDRDACGKYEDTGERFWYCSQNVTAWMPLPEPYGGK